MADNNLLGKSHKQYVQDQIKVRQEILGKGARDSKELSWMNGKTSWVRLASSIDVKNAITAVTAVDSNGNYVDPSTVTTGSLFQPAPTIQEVTNDAGEKRLSLLGLDDSYMGDVLANSLVLHGGTEKHNTTPDQMFKRRGISTSFTNSSQNISAYNSKNGDFGLVAMPGIQSVDIKSKSMGSLREASISLRINDPEQLELIETLYLRIGYSVFLEWGNSSYYKHNSNGDPTLVKGPNVEPGLLFDFLIPPDDLKDCPTKFIQKIEKIREESQGNYDALFGRVKNFSWEFSPEGFYNATLEVISWGDIIESLSIGGFYPNVVLNKLNADEDADTTTNTPPEVDRKDESLLNGFIYEASLPTLSEVETIFIDSTSGTRTPIIEKIFQPTKSTLKGKTTKETKAVAGNTQIKQSSGTKTLSTVGDYSFALQYDREKTNSFGKVIEGMAVFGENITYSYIRLGDILDFIKTRLMLYTENCDDTPIIDINTDTDTNYCYNPQINVSADPSKVMINSKIPVSMQGLKNLANNRNREYNDVDPIKEDNQIKRAIFGLEKFGEKNVKLEPFTQNKVLSEGKQIANVPVGLIMNIYFEKEFLYSTIDQLRDKKTGKLSLYKFLKSLLDEANNCLGGVNKLDLRVVNDQTLEIYDQIPIYEWKKTIPEPQPFNIFGLSSKPTVTKPDGTQSPIINDGSFVTNFGLKTELTNEFATITSIGAQANGSVVGEDATFLSKWNFGLEDRFYPKKLDSYSKLNKGNNIDFELEEYKALLNKMLELWSDYSLQSTHLSELTRESFIGIGADINNGYAFPYFRTKSASSYVKLQKDFFQAAIKMKARTQKVLSNQIGMLPINLNLEMDGISGIRIYDQIRVNTRFLPSYYPKFLMFIIKGVSHSFNGNRWVTKIDTIAQPKVQFSTNPNLDDDTDDAVNEIVEEDANEAAQSEGLIDVTPTYRGSKKVVIDAYGWPIKVQEIQGKYYAESYSQDSAKRNLYRKSSEYLKNNTVEFEYNLKLQGSLVKPIKIKYLLKDFVIPLTTVLESIEQNDLTDGVYNIGASIYPRDTTGTKNVGSLSGHSFGVAVDVNSAQYPYGKAGYEKYKKDLKAGIPAAKVIKTFVDSGLFNWGGDYNYTKDAHHFSLKVVNGKNLNSI